MNVKFAAAEVTVPVVRVLVTEASVTKPPVPVVTVHPVDVAIFKTVCAAVV